MNQPTGLGSAFGKTHRQRKGARVQAAPSVSEEKRTPSFGGSATEASADRMGVYLRVLMGLFILLRLLQRHIALLRALGAPSRFGFALVWSCAAALIVSGAALGLLAGVAAAAAISRAVTARTDMLTTAAIGWTEVHSLAAFVSAALILALIPAAVILRRPVVEGLRG